MHEFSISHKIAKVVLDKAREQGAKEVLRVEIEIGELSFLNPEQVEFWVKIGFEKTIASLATISIKVIEPQILCKVCGYAGKLKMFTSFTDAFGLPFASLTDAFGLRENEPMYHILLPSFSCPKCNSNEIEIERGRECLIKRIELLA